MRETNCASRALSIKPKRGVHPPVRALEAAIKHYLALTNGQAKPVVWTKTADVVFPQFR